MKSFALTFLLMAMAVVRGGTAEFPPALQALAEQFNKNWQTLITSSTAQIAPARDRYLAVLTAARTAATAAAKTADLAALKTEFEGVQANALPAEPPPDLPKTLAGDRRTYVTTAATMARTVAPRQRDLASKYVQSLAALEATALRTKDTALSEAVAGEKRRAMALLESSGGGAKHPVEAKADTNWKRFTGRIDLPATAKTLKVTIGAHGAAGIFDFDDIEVQFR